MTAAPTVTVNRHLLETIIDDLVELLDTADRVAAIEAEKASKEAEG